MKPIHVILTATLVAAIASYATIRIAAPHMNASVIASETKKESVYDRVMRTGLINCGYMVWPPFLIKDVNTNAFTGIIPDVTEKMAATLGLKVNWSMEVGIGDFANALDAGKIDMLCAPVTYTASRSRVSDFTGEIGYMGYYAYSRPGDERFASGDLSRINAEDILVSVQDGEMTALTARNSFPKAKTNQISQLTSNSLLYQNVVNKKADVIFSDRVSMADFLKNTPDSLVQIGDKPIGVFGLAYAVKADEYRFARLVDWTMRELQNTGQVDAVLRKYGLGPDIFLRMQKPYQYMER